MSEQVNITRVGDNPELEPYAKRIDKAKGQLVGGMLDIGKALTEAKEKYGRKPDTNFKQWVEGRCGFSLSKAKLLLAVYSTFAKRINVYPFFEDSAAYLLSAPSCPEGARDEAIELAEAGERVSHKKAKEIIADWKGEGGEDEDGDEPGEPIFDMSDELVKWTAALRKTLDRVPEGEHSRFVKIAQRTFREYVK